MPVSGGLVGQGDKFHLVHIQSLNGRLAEVRHVGDGEIGLYIVLEDGHIVDQVGQQHIGLEALLYHRRQEGLLGFDAAQIPVRIAVAAVVVVAVAHHPHGGLSVQQLIALTQMDVEVLGGVVIVHVPGDIEVDPADGVHQLAHRIPLNNHMEVGVDAGELAHFCFQRVESVISAAGPVVHPVELHNLVAEGDIGIPGQAHYRQLLVGHVVGRQHHDIGVAAAAGVLAHNQEGIALLLPGPGQAGDLYRDLIAVLVDRGGVNRVGHHRRRGGKQPEGGVAYHNDRRDDCGHNKQNMQDLLPAGALGLGAFRLFSPGLPGRLFQPGAPMGVLILWVHARIPSMSVFGVPRYPAVWRCLVQMDGLKQGLDRSAAGQQPVPGRLCVWMDGYAALGEICDAHLHPQQQGPVQILIGQGPQPVYTWKIPVGLDIVGQVDYLLQQGHIRLAGGVPEDSPKCIFVHAVHCPGNPGAGLGVEQLGGGALHIIQNDTILPA